MELIIEYMKEWNAKSNKNGFERYLKEKTEEAFERGYKRGIKEGKEEWRKEQDYEIIKKMQQENISLDLIKRITGLSEKEITKIINNC